MRHPIKVGELLTHEQGRQAKAAIVLEGLSAREWAEKKGLDYFRVSKQLNRKEPVIHDRYARAWRALLGKHFTGAAAA